MLIVLLYTVLKQKSKVEWKQKERRKYKALKIEPAPASEPYDFAKELKKLPNTDAKGVLK